MGITGLRQLLEDNAPNSMKMHKLKDYLNRKIAVDASISIYQFMIALRSRGKEPLKNKKGEETSHLVGLFKRAAKFLMLGIEPIYVFDGTPPQMKKPELDRRNIITETAKKQLDLLGADQDGDIQKDKDVEKLRKMAVRATPKEYDDCKKLLGFMGIPVIQAPGEAEAQCSQLCKDKHVYAVASEDSDCLTFGAPRMLMNFKASDNEIIKEFRYEKVLEELRLTDDQFIDLCILCGCDYCERIKGIKGKELELIRKHGSIEGVLQAEDSYECPDDWRYKEARCLFKAPDVNRHLPKEKLQSTELNEEGLIQFLVEGNDFGEDSLSTSIKRIKRGANMKWQQRVDVVFKKRKEGSGEDTEQASNKKAKA